MDRRIAIAWAASASVTIGIAIVAIVAVDGVFFVDAAPVAQDGKRVELVDDYVVVHSSTATASPAALSTGITVAKAALTAGSNITPGPAAEVAFAVSVESANAPTPAVADATESAAPAPSGAAPIDSDDDAAERDDDADEVDDDPVSTEPEDRDEDDKDDDKEADEAEDAADEAEDAADEAEDAADEDESDDD